MVSSQKKQEKKFLTFSEIEGVGVWGVSPKLKFLKLFCLFSFIAFNWGYLLSSSETILNYWFTFVKFGQSQRESRDRIRNLLAQHMQHASFFLTFALMGTPL